MTYRTYHLPNDLVAAVRNVAKKQRIEQNKIVEEALREFLEKYKRFSEVERKIQNRLITKLSVNLPRDLIEMLDKYAKENKIRMKSDIVSAALFEYFNNHMPNQLTVKEDKGVQYGVIGVRFSEKTYIDLWHLAGMRRVPVSYVIEEAILEFLNKYENMDLESVIESEGIPSTELYYGKSQISVHMARKTRERLEEYARKNNTTMSIVVRAAVKLYLDKMNVEVN
ncbi:MAG: ribbon-helix-helix domain-containing protein [Thermoplasmata archaeon]